jgi:uncharacterized membrane protein
MEYSIIILILGVISLICNLAFIYYIFKLLDEKETQSHEDLERLMSAFEAGRELDRSAFERQDWCDWSDFIDKVD